MTLPLSLDQVKALAGRAPAETPPKMQQKSGRPGNQPFELEAWLTKYNIEIKSAQPYEGGKRFILRACPFNPDHTGTSAAVFQLGDGGIGFKCQHSSCADNNWSKLREKFEPGYRDRRKSHGEYKRNNRNNGHKKGNGHGNGPLDQTEPFDPGDGEPSGLSEVHFRTNTGTEEGNFVSYKYDGDGEPDPIPMSNFSAKIMDVITTDDGLNKKKKFRIIGQRENGELLEDAEVDADQFDAMGWIRENWDTRALISSDKTATTKVRLALLLGSQEAKRLTVYIHGGWRRIDERWVFLTHGSAIGAQGASVEFKEDNLTGYTLPQPSSSWLGEECQASLDYLEIGSHKVLLPIWAAMYMAPLSSIIDTGFALFLKGRSGTYKSGITALALNHFGPSFNYNRLPGSWTSTENKLEKDLFLLKDLPYIIDDWAPGQDSIKAKALEGKAERIIRAQANRQSRGRMNEKTYDPRGVLVSSGEHLPGGHSANARTFVIEIFRGDIDRAKLLATLKSKRLYSQCMAEYIAWIGERYEQLMVELPQKEQRWEDAVVKYAEHPRLPGAVGALYAGLDTALEFMKFKGVVSQARANEILQEGWQCFIDWTVAQSARVEAERPGRRFVGGLLAMLKSGRYVMGSISDSTQTKSLEPGQVQIGWMDEAGNYLLDPEGAYKEVRQYLERSDEPLTFKEEAVWQDLRDLNFSECYKNRTRYRQRFVYLKGEPDWVIKLRVDAIRSIDRPEDN
jgi:hypothetical protein